MLTNIMSVYNIAREAQGCNIDTKILAEYLLPDYYKPNG